MTRKLNLILVMPALALAAAVAFSAAQSQPGEPDEPNGKSADAATNNSTRTATHSVGPGPNDGHIAFITAAMLQHVHYLHHRLDDAISEKFFDRYLETLDPQHLHFTQEDITEFERYRDRLDNLTITRKREADTTPAYEVFNRFVERLSQRVAYADELLKTEKFEFNTDERMLANRRESPYPKDLAEAKRLWRQRLRFEYLQERLARHDAKKKSDEPGTPGTNSVVAAPADPTRPAAEDKEVKKKTDDEEITDLLSRRYHRNLHMFQEWDNEDVLEKYLTSLAHVYDPHSDYMNASGAKNFAIGMNLALFGIGAVLTTDLDGYCKIQELKPGPAMKSKQIKVGDRIVAVAQGDAPPVDVVEMNLSKAVQLIRGAKGTEVRLTIIPVDSPAERRVVSLIRDEIKLEDQEVKAKVIELPDSAGKMRRLGVIDLPTFYATIDRPVELAGDGAGAEGNKITPRYTSVDVGKMLRKFKEVNVDGVILDLRRNGGGSLEEAIRLTGLFIKEGPVVQVRTADDRRFVRGDEDAGLLYDGPLVVLTSRFSASASEIVAGAMQDYGRAVVVGDISTHGKGTVQNLNPLAPYVEPATATATNDPGQLKITIQKFYRASGTSTQLRGVMPDIVLPSVLNYSKEIGEDALDNPLPWDTIASTKYEKVNLVSPCLAELLKRSSERVATNQDFAYIREDIDLYRKRQEDKTISLNEQERLKEKAEADARQKARDEERRARKKTERTIYELALKDTDRPGLPLPVGTSNSLSKVEGEFHTIVVTRTNYVHDTNFVKANGGKGQEAVQTTTGNEPAGVSGKTNVLATTTSSASPPGVDRESDEEKSPNVDATLEEAERILMDYISVLSQKSLLTVNR